MNGGPSADSESAHLSRIVTRFASLRRPLGPGPASLRLKESQGPVRGARWPQLSHCPAHWQVRVVNDINALNVISLPENTAPLVCRLRHVLSSRDYRDGTSCLWHGQPPHWHSGSAQHEAAIGTMALSNRSSSFKHRAALSIWGGTTLQIFCSKRTCKNEQRFESSSAKKIKTGRCMQRNIILILFFVKQEYILVLDFF